MSRISRLPLRMMEEAHEDGAADPLGPLRALIAEPRHLTIRQVANRSGMALADLREVYRALGRSTDELLGESAVVEAEALRAAQRGVGLAALVRLARSRRLVASQLAAADVAAMRDELLAPLRGAGDADVGAALAETVSALWPVTTQLLVNSYRRALERLLGLDLVADIARHPEAAVPLAVGFVDVVGYTRFAAEVDPRHLADVLETFERHVLDVAGSHEHLTVPKFIGDAAMVVSTDVVVLAGGLLDMVEPVDGLAETPLRGGMAAGETLVRVGDYFGRPVNLAARLTEYARPATVLADEALHDVLAGHFDLRRIPRLRLHGLGSHRPLAVRRPNAEE